MSFLEADAAQSFAGFADKNPLFAFISVYRAALIGHPLDTTMLVASVLWAVAIGMVGVGAFVRYEGKIARHL